MRTTLLYVFSAILLWGMMCMAALPAQPLPTPLPADDWPALQSLVNALPATGGKIDTPPGHAPYRLSQPVDCRGKGVVFDGHGDTFIMTSPNYPTNETFIFGALLTNAPRPGHPDFAINDANSPQPAPIAAFAGAIANGQTTLTVPGVFRVGQSVFLWLGSCPTDPTLPDVGEIATVTAAAQGTISIDRPVPRDIRGSAHKIFGVDALGDGSELRNVNLDWAATCNPDIQIRAELIRGFTAAHIRGRFSLGLVGSFASEVFGSDFAGTTLAGSGRIFGGWQLVNSGIRDAHIVETKHSNIVFLEGEAQDISLSRIMVDSTDPAAWGTGAFFLDGAQNLSVDGLVINAAAPTILLSQDGTAQGTNHSGLSYSRVDVNRPVGGYDLREITSGRIHGVPLGRLQTISYTAALTHGHYFEVPRGVIVSMWVTPPPHVTAIYLRPNNAGPGIPVNGQAVDLLAGQLAGPWNDAPNLGVAVGAIDDDGQFTSGTMPVTATVFPAGNALP